MLIYILLQQCGDGAAVRSCSSLSACPRAVLVAGAYALRSFTGPDWLAVRAVAQTSASRGIAGSMGVSPTWSRYSRTPLRWWWSRSAPNRRCTSCQGGAVFRGRHCCAAVARAGAAVLLCCCRPSRRCCAAVAALLLCCSATDVADAADAADAADVACAAGTQRCCSRRPVAEPDTEPDAEPDALKCWFSVSSELETSTARR